MPGSMYLIVINIMQLIARCA